MSNVSTANYTGKVIYKFVKAKFAKAPALKQREITEFGKYWEKYMSEHPKERDSMWLEWDVFNMFLKVKAKELWKTLEDVPVNPSTECLEEEWHGFPIGTSKYDIWNWFEDTYYVSVAEDLVM